MGDENLTPVDVIIRKLLAVRDKPQTEVRNLTNEELMFLCRETRSVDTRTSVHICRFFVIGVVRSF